MSKHIGFGYMGGKLSHLPFLLSLLPFCQQYVELFGGCAAVLINRKVASIEVYNDLNEDLYNFFRVLRDDGERLVELLRLTTMSRSEFAAAIEGQHKGSAIERARCFFVLLLQVRLCSPTDPYLSAGRWNFAVSRKGNGRDGIRCGISAGVSRFINKVEQLPEIIRRLRSVHIENVPALKAIEIYDGPDTLFYADPPYPHESRSKSNIYRFEMSNDDHIKLAAALHNIKGRAAVSGYDCKLNRKLYKNWFMYKSKERLFVYNKYGKTRSRQEILWTNYNASEMFTPKIKKDIDIGSQLELSC